MRPDVQLETLRAIAERVVQSYGLDLFDVQLRREPIGLVLRVVIDHPTRFDKDGNVVVEPVERGIGIEDCQRVSQDLGTVLDVEDPVAEQYTLEVSSPGIDRSLRGPDDFRRFVGRVAKIVLSEPMNGQVHFEGRMRAIESNEVVLEVSRTKIVRIPLDRISRAKLAVEF